VWAGDRDVKRLALVFSSCEFFHVLRGLNVAAHLLARSCASFPSFVWCGVAPDCTREVIYNDILMI
jgi:hypothetical protein